MKAAVSDFPTLLVPQEAAALLPKTGPVRIIMLTGDQSDDAAWYASAYQQFLRDDAPEDSVYDSLREDVLRDFHL